MLQALGVLGHLGRRQGKDPIPLAQIPINPSYIPGTTCLGLPGRTAYQARPPWHHPERPCHSASNRQSQVRVVSGYLVLTLGLQPHPQVRWLDPPSTHPNHRSPQEVGQEPKRVRSGHLMQPSMERGQGRLRRGQGFHLRSGVVGS